MELRVYSRQIDKRPPENGAALYQQIQAKGAVMNKSVYSLVLMDDVIDAIDRMACAEGTSRSSLINRILAQYVNLTTPEMRMKDIFSSMQQLIHDSLQLQFMPSDSMISIRSPLRYKYKPTIRYGLELYRSLPR